MDKVVQTIARLLDMCDSIYILQGWDKSCGANREYSYALAKDMIIMFEKE